MLENSTQNTSMVENLTQKIKNNASIAYLFIFINTTFLFSKNKNINNEFVKNHTKTAILIHLWFLVNTIIFVYYWLWFYTEIMWYNISDIIAISIYLILFWMLIFWAYKAYSWNNFKISETLNYKNNAKLLDIVSDWKFWEKDKLTILLCRIPFIWFILYPKYKTNQLINSITKLTLIFSLFISILYIYWNPNLATFLILLYIIFFVFTNINLYLKDEIININLDKIPNFEEILKYLKASKIYLKNYIKSEKYFPSLWEIKEKLESEDKIKNEKEEQELKTKENFKLNKSIIYIPILNLISLFNLNTKQKKHIINWVLLSILFIILFTIYWINNKYQLLLFFPLSFSYWFMKAWVLNYEIPFIYDVFNIFIWIKNYIKSIFIKAKKIKNTETEVNLKVSEDKINDQKEESLEKEKTENKIEEINKEKFSKETQLEENNIIEKEIIEKD